MKFTKKIVAVVAGVAMCAGLAACGGSRSPDSTCKCNGWFRVGLF